MPSNAQPENREFALHGPQRRNSDATTPDRRDPIKAAAVRSAGRTALSATPLLRAISGCGLSRRALWSGRRGLQPGIKSGIGASPSGKAADFDSAMRRFESSRPSQLTRYYCETFSIPVLYQLEG
jgi:hypothetical protein